MSRKKLDTLTYGIVGLGRFGYALATELAKSGAELLVLDGDEEKVREMREITENALVVKSLDKKTLAETGIQNCDVAVVCIGEQIATSILTTLNLVGEILAKLGAEVVYPERDMAVRLANRLETGRVLDSIQLSERLTISKIIVPDKLAGKTVVDANLRSRFGLNIIAIASGSHVQENISPNYSFCKGDILFLSGSRDGLMELSQWAEEK